MKTKYSDRIIPILVFMVAITPLLSEDNGSKLVEAFGKGGFARNSIIITCLGKDKLKKNTESARAKQLKSGEAYCEPLVKAELDAIGCQRTFNGKSGSVTTDYQGRYSGRWVYSSSDCATSTIGCMDSYKMVYDNSKLHEYHNAIVICKKQKLKHEYTKNHFRVSCTGTEIADSHNAKSINSVRVNGQKHCEKRLKTALDASGCQRTFEYKGGGVTPASGWRYSGNWLYKSNNCSWSNKPRCPKGETIVIRNKQFSRLDRSSVVCKKQ